MNAPTKLRTRKCRICREPYMQLNSLKVTCGKFECQVAFGLKHAEKSQSARAKKERKETRKAKDAMKTPRDLIPEAQIVFNRFIRLRDADEPCISCGRIEVEYTIGGQWDCGHFMSVGAKPELRFEEKNAYKQCKKCNGGSKYARKSHTVAQEYEIRLRAKVGDELVDWLKGPHAPKHYSTDDLRAIKALYQSKCKELQQ
jgi:ferredoxin